MCASIRRASIPLACAALIVAVWDLHHTYADDARLLDVNGRERTGQVTAMADGVLTLKPADADEVRLPLTDLVRLEFTARKSPPLQRGAAVFLANGDRLAMNPETLDELAVTGNWTAFPAWEAVSVPLETVQGIVFDLPQLPTRRAELLADVLKPRAGSDVALLKNGDRLSGRITGLSGGRLSLDSGGVKHVGIEDVRALTLDADLVSFPLLSGPRVLLTLTDGSWITVTEPRLTDTGVLETQTATGKPLTLSLGEVTSLRFLGGKAVWVSEREPSAYHFTPYLSTEWELARNRNVLGRPLRLRGREYPLGLGTHSRAELVYELGEKYRRLSGVLGVDDAARGGGAVIFAVDADGRRIFESPPQNGRDDPLPLDLDISGVQRLTLITEFGPLADVRDYADWCDFVLLP